jgi:hypothetical protein
VVPEKKDSASTPAQTNRKKISEIAKMKDFQANIGPIVKDLCARYPEIVWLTSKTNVTPEGIVSKDQKISQQLFGETHIEFDKVCDRMR